MLDRLIEKIDLSDPDGCWIWTGALSRGYGNFWTGERYVPVHRLVYELFVELIPEGLEPDHLCRVRACCNPDHLELVTRSVNIRRGESVAAQRAAQTHCHRGHPFDAANTHISARGTRECRACHRDREAVRRARSRAA
jgi:hypothetical protein